VDDPVAFRNSLGCYSGLISESFAIQFFERVLWLDSDMDVFFDTKHGYHKMVKYLVEKVTLNWPQRKTARYI
jgi:hypothetical protein